MLNSHDPPDPDVEGVPLDEAAVSDSEPSLSSATVVASGRRAGWTPEYMQSLFPALSLLLCQHLLEGKVVLDDDGTIQDVH